MNFERLMVASACLCAAGATAACDVDLDLTTAFDLELPYHNLNITVPPLPADINLYKYATESAMVAVPVDCLSSFSTELAAAVDLDDRQPCGPTGMKYIRVFDLVGGYTTLASMADCSRGLVIGFHGSGGPGWDAVQYAAMLSGMGFVVVIPDSMAMPDSLGLKGKLPHKDTADIVRTNFCGEYLANDGKCKAFNKPYCYQSKFDNIVHDSDSYRKLVEGVYQIRKRELDYFFQNQTATLDAFSSVFADGNSEGGMVLSRYHHAELEKVLSGRIIDSWSCEFNYYTACPEFAKVCEDKCDKTVPLLNVIGDKDEYFGATSGSLAYKVAEDSNGYGAETLQGHCRKTFNDQGFTQATVIVSEGAWHGPNYYDNNLVRAAIADFVSKNTPGSSGSLDACTLSGGVYSCPREGPSTCKTIDDVYQVNPNASEVCELTTTTIDGLSESGTAEVVMSIAASLPFITALSF